jgi:hypothetical protein
MDEIWGGNMSIMHKRIKNIAKAMDNAKDLDMKRIWNIKLEQLLEIRGRKAFEGLENQARVVH